MNEKQRKAQKRDKQNTEQQHTSKKRDEQQRKATIKTKGQYRRSGLGSSRSSSSSTWDLQLTRGRENCTKRRKVKEKQHHATKSKDGMKKDRPPPIDDLATIELVMLEQLGRSVRLVHLCVRACQRRRRCAGLRHARPDEVGLPVASSSLRIGCHGLSRRSACRAAG